MMMNQLNLPSPETLKAYEQLGIVGILIGILLVGVGAVGVGLAWAARTIFRWSKEWGGTVTTLLQEQTLAIRESNAAEQIHTKALEEHSREVDDLRNAVNQTLSCSAKECPAREARAHIYSLSPPRNIGRPVRSEVS